MDNIFCNHHLSSLCHPSLVLKAAKNRESVCVCACLCSAVMINTGYNEQVARIGISTDWVKLGLCMSTPLKIIDICPRLEKKKKKRSR